jgi:hypothetical protein
VGSLFHLSARGVLMLFQQPRKTYHYWILAINILMLYGFALIAIHQAQVYRIYLIQLMAPALVLKSLVGIFNGLGEMETNNHLISLAF